MAGDGKGHFSTATSLTLPGNAQKFELSDLNHDGLLDIVATTDVFSGGGYGDGGVVAAAFSFQAVAAFSATTSNVEHKVITYFNQGNGTFGTSTEYTFDAQSDALTLADVNRDGRPDAVFSGGYVSSGITVLLNQGNGTLGQPINYGTGTTGYNLTQRDLNGDGAIDFILTDQYPGSFSVFLNDGNGAFGTPTTYSLGDYYGNFLVGDLTSDGRPEIIAYNAYQKNQIAILNNNGDGTFASPTLFATSGQPISVGLGDLSNDGNSYLIVNSFIPKTAGMSEDRYYLTTYLNDGQGNLSYKTQVNVGARINDIQLRDLNGDGKVDILGSRTQIDPFYTYITTAQDEVVLLGNGDGTLQDVNSMPAMGFSNLSGINAEPLAVGDFNNDGITDTARVDVGTAAISIVLRGSDGYVASTQSFVAGYVPKALKSVDLNGDGALDLVATISGTENYVAVLMNQGDGKFKLQPIHYAVGTDPRSVVAADLNGDGRADIATANLGDSSVSVLYGNGDGTFAPQVIYSMAVGSAPTAIAVGDENLDGRLDIFVARPNSSEISVFEQQQNGQFALTQSYSVGWSPASIALADVNGDGTVDMVTANYGGSLSVLYGKTGGGFEAATSYNLTHRPTVVKIADFNMDGFLDLASISPEVSMFTVLLGNSSGHFSSASQQNFKIGAYYASNFEVGAGSLDIIGNGWVNQNNASKAGSTLKQVTRSRTYDPKFNKLTSDTDEFGRTTLHEIDPNTGNILSMIRVVGAVGGDDDLVTRYTYTAQGQTDLEIDPLGHITDNDYDTQGRLIKVTTAKGTSDEAVQQYEYDASGNRIAMIDENGNRTIFVYDSLNRVVQEIKADPDGNGPLTSPITRYEYDAEGNQTAVTDSRGYTTYYEYDALDRATNTTNALGAVTSNEYDRAGNLVATTDELGRRTQYRYDSRNRKIESIDPEGGRTQYLYDANDNQIAEIDALGRRTNSVYDARNRLIRKTDPLNGSTTYLYDAVGNLIVQTDPNGHQTKFTYDDLNRRIKTTDALGNVETSSYDKDGNLIAKTDALGQTTTFTYDNRNRLIAKIDPLGGRTSMTYDGVGNVLSRTDELNRTTTYRYDALNRQVSVTDPLGHTTSYTYDSQGNRVAITDALNHSTTYTYDALNRQVGMTDALGGTKTMAYDAVGNLIAQTDELNRTSLFSYNSRNLLTATTDPLNHTSTKTYDAVGNVLTTADALEHTTRYGYDTLDRKVSTTDAVGQTTLMTYDRVGNLLSLTDPDQNTTTYTYDALDRQLADTNQLGLSRTYTYNAVGNETSIVDRDGRKTSYVYDALNRQTQENWLDASGNPMRTTNRSYDAASQLTVISDPDSRYSYTYDLAGRLTSVDNTGTPGVPTVLLGYTYDAANNKLTTTDTINGLLKGTETYTYDALNRNTRITQSGNGVSDKRVGMTYDAASQMTGVARYADLLGAQSVANSDYSYDLAGRLTRLTNNSTTTTYADYQWTYDAANRITQYVSPDGTSNYNYDDRDQLVGTDHNYQTDEAYSYDANGNRTNAGYQTGQENRLLNDGTYSYTYDDEGNRTSSTSIATSEITEYTWDYRNRLISIVSRLGGGVTRQVDYTYDTFDHRIGKVVDLDGAGSVAPTTERYIYDGQNISLVFDGQGNQIERYLHGPKVDQVLAEEVNGQTQWMLADNQGSIRQITDDSGTVLNQIDYDSFGNINSQSNPTAFFRFGYTGREWDSETGQYYYRARYYDPKVGQFISQDPIGFAARDANLYRYVGNSPTNGTDPSGKYKVEIEYDPIQFGQHHARIIFIRGDRKRFAYEAGPSNGGSTNAISNIIGFNGSSGYLVPSSRLGEIDPNPAPPSLNQFVYEEKCLSEKDKEGERKAEITIREAFEALTPAKIIYSTLHRNSNSAAFHALRTLFPSKHIVPKVDAPAWEINPFTSNVDPRSYNGRQQPQPQPGPQPSTGLQRGSY